jgi:hypothetical protein
MHGKVLRTHWHTQNAKAIYDQSATIMDQLQTSGELQDKTSFIDPLTGVDLLKGCSPDYLLL